jgi:hypothetical protein
MSSLWAEFLPDSGSNLPQPPAQVAAQRFQEILWNLLTTIVQDDQDIRVHHEFLLH